MLCWCFPVLIESKRRGAVVHLHGHLPCGNPSNRKLREGYPVLFLAFSGPAAGWREGSGQHSLRLANESKERANDTGEEAELVTKIGLVVALNRKAKPREAEQQTAEDSLPLSRERAGGGVVFWVGLWRIQEARR